MTAQDIRENIEEIQFRKQIESLKMEALQMCLRARVNNEKRKARILRELEGGREWSIRSNT